MKRKIPKPVKREKKTIKYDYVVIPEENPGYKRPKNADIKILIKNNDIEGFKQIVELVKANNDLKWFVEESVHHFNDRLYYSAIYDDRVDIVKEMMTLDGFDVNNTGVYESFILPGLNKRFEMFKLIIEHPDCHMRVYDNEQHNALEYAVQFDENQQCFELLDILHKKDASLFKNSESGALNEVVKRGDVERVEKLLSMMPEGEVNIAYRGKTPLYFAAQTSEDMVRYLLSRDDIYPNINMGNDFFVEEPITVLNFDDFVSPNIKTILEADKEENPGRWFEDELGKPVVNDPSEPYRIHSNFETLIEQNNESEIKRLFDLHAESNPIYLKSLVNQVFLTKASTSQKTYLHKAIYLNRPWIVKLLLEHGADPTRFRMWTPLYKAVGNDQVEIVQMLLDDSRVNPNGNQHNGPGNDRTPLQSAITRKKDAIIDMIINHPRFDVNALNGDGKPLLISLIEDDFKGDVYYERLLKIPSFDINYKNSKKILSGYFKAACLKELNLAYTIVTDPRFKPTAEDVYSASWINDERVIKALMEKGLSEYIMKPNFIRGDTPLHNAARLGNDRVVDYLLNGPYADKVNKYTYNVRKVLPIESAKWGKRELSHRPSENYDRIIEMLSDE